MTCHSLFESGKAMAYRTTPKMVERKQARRQRLLNVALRLFGRKGFHATTVPKIVAAAHSSIGSFYSYFKNKEDIYAAVLEAIGESIAQALNRAIAAAGPGVLRQMRAAVKALVQFLADHPEEARILIIESSGLGQRLETVRRNLVRSHTRSVEHALAAIRAELPSMDTAVLDTAVVASCWVGAVYEAVFHWLEQPAHQRLPADQLAQAIARFNLRAVGAPEEILQE
ncbi:MAG: TetR/AcrR family transcriptional regulator [Bryobacteraceae bacterium]|jgi:AcrR family transcriptional regulator